MSSIHDKKAFIHSDPPTKVLEPVQIYRKFYDCWDQGTMKHATTSKAMLELQYATIEKSFKDILSYDLKINIEYIWFSDEFTAQASYKENKITFCINHMRQSDIRSVIVHEIAHILHYRFTDECPWHDMSDHNFFFGAFTAILKKQVIGWKENFFDPYDNHQDGYAKDLWINMHWYDSVINSAPAKTVLEAVKSANIVARRMEDIALASRLSSYNIDVDLFTEKG